MTLIEKASQAVSESLCSPFVELLPVTGASLSVFGNDRRQSAVCSSDATAARINELQFDLGEGPQWDTRRSAQPVLIDDVRGDEDPRWPVFGAAVQDLEVGALFTLPLVMGAAVVGVVELYRTTPGWLRPRDLAEALSLAAAISGPAVQHAVDSANREDSTETAKAPALRREVHQATGMILAQLNVNATDAFQHLKVHAFASGRTVQDVSRDVVARRLDFSKLRD